ncbi:hypothetical protein C1645_755860 [Glomus cerebriforme]|uniref:F-box domain-containing protein n=1 Tax=Glomus cerebriforme TaxID=658196 RepID=A0A397TLX9_9GLOM|nr:hypothetical protein C1645_755860 [Glomus cerebriforme]
MKEDNLRDISNEIFSNHNDESNNSLTQIPPEILELICDYLCPKDLFSLTLVCKHLRSFLWSFTSSMTQQIWHNARIKLSIVGEYKGIPPPPEGIMSEQQYIWLIHLVDACQFCGNKRRGASKIYWPFKMYSCVNCIDSRILSNESAKQKGVSYTVFDVLPHIVLYRNNNGSNFDSKLDRYCLKSEALETQKEYEGIVNFEERIKWIEMKKRHQLMINDKLVQYTLREESKIQRIWREEYRSRFGFDVNC